eukprot:Nk52_evm4s1762 gene=Nk52_evmTU4s1762
MIGRTSRESDSLLINEEGHCSVNVQQEGDGIARVHRFNKGSGYLGSFYIIYVTAFIDFAGFGLLFPLLPYYFKEISTDGPDGLAFGLIVGSFSGGQLLGSFVFGCLSDSLGRKPILIVSLFGSAVFFFLTGLSNSVNTLLLTRGLAGFFASSAGICSAYISDCTTVSERPKHIGRLGGACGLGFIAGPVIGSFMGNILDVHRGFHAASFLASAACVLNTLFAFRYFKECETTKYSLNLSKEQTIQLQSGECQHSENHWCCVPMRTQKSGQTSAWSSPILFKLKILFTFDLIAVYMTTFLTSMVFVIMETTVVLFLKEKFDIAVSYAGLMFAIYGMAMIVVEIFVFHRIDKALGTKECLKWSCLLCGAGIGVIPYISSEVSAYFCLLLMAISQGILFPGLSVIACLYTNEDNFGCVLGARRAFGALARTIGPFIGGVLYDTTIDWQSLKLLSYPHALPFLAGGLLGLFSCLFMANITPPVENNMKTMIPESSSCLLDEAFVGDGSL